MLIDVLVGLIRQGHDLAHGFGVLAALVMRCHRAASVGKLRKQLRGGQGVGHASVTTAVHKAGATAGDVHQFAHQVRIHAGDEVLQFEIDVIHRRPQLGCIVVTQIVRCQVLQIGLGSDESPAPFGHLLPVHGQEPVGENAGWGAVAGPGQHRRPEQGMEVDDILTEKVVQLNVRIGAPVGVEVDLSA